MTGGSSRPTFNVHPLILEVTVKDMPYIKPGYLYLPTSQQKIERTLLRFGARAETGFQLGL